MNGFIITSLSVLMACASSVPTQTQNMVEPAGTQFLLRRPSGTNGHMVIWVENVPTVTRAEPCSGFDQTLDPLADGSDRTIQM